jgi:hypothetical protein
MSQALIEAVVDSATEGGSESDSPYSVDTGVFERFDARLEELFWWEGPNGALYATEEERAPEFAVKITVDGAELDVEEIEAPRFGRTYRLLNSPGEDTSPQFD